MLNCTDAKMSKCIKNGKLMAKNTKSEYFVPNYFIIRKNQANKVPEMKAQLFKCKLLQAKVFTNVTKYRNKVNILRYTKSDHHLSHFYLLNYQKTAED